MTSDLFPYVNLRRREDGSIRPRFTPGPRERALGFVPEDLRHADGPRAGQWFTLDDTAKFAARRMAEILAARSTGKRVKVIAPRGRTVNDLLDAYFASDDFKRLAPATQADYGFKAQAIRFRPRDRVRVADMPGTSRRERERAYQMSRPALMPETFAMAPATAVEPPEVKAFFEYLVKARGLAMARGSIAVLSAAYKWARLSTEWRIPVNPCLNLDLPAPRTDVVIYEVEEFNALCAMGDMTGDETIVDAAILALCTDQRPGDVLAFTIARISDGVVRLVQGKTGARVEIKVMTMLADRLELMAKRRQARGWNCHELVVDDRIGAAFTERAFNGRWLGLIARTAAGDARPGLAPCPSIAGKMFKHLRKTTFTWLDRSGSDLKAISNISGHTLGSIPQVAKHYLAPDAEGAAAAIDRLEAWMRVKGVKM